MCFGKSKSQPPPPVPPPAQPTKFGYVSADYSNEKPQKMAAIESAKTASPAFGSELGAPGNGIAAGVPATP